MAEDEKRGEDLQQELESLYEKVASADSPEGGREPGTGTGDTAEPEEAERWDPPGRRFRLDEKLRAFWTAPPYPGILLCVLLLLGSAGIALWPSLYHYGAIDLEGGAYPLRINRLTGEATYYDGRSWSLPPVAPKAGRSKPADAKPLPAPASPASPPGEIKTAGPPPAETGKASGAKAPPSGEKKAGAIPPAAAQTARKDIRQAPFAIQIRAFPEERRKEALALGDTIEKQRPDVFIEKASLGGRGVWYRVMLGPFATRDEAAAHLKRTGLTREFPGSFIQKRTGTAP